MHLYILLTTNEFTHTVKEVESFTTSWYMMALTSSFVLVLMCYMTPFSVQGECNCENSIIMVNNNNGPLVVQAVIDKMEHLGFGFENDHSFIRRVAYIETQDGRNVNQHHVGGIWAMNQTKLDILNTSKVLDIIKINGECEPIEIDKLLTETSMTIPLYSGMAARLYLEHLITNDNYDMSDINIQAHLWFAKYRTGNLTVDDYKRIVAGRDLNDKKALNGIGSEVVEDVIKMIDSWKNFSRLSDNCLMRRIALVETNDGLHDQQCGGIWAMDKKKLTYVRRKLRTSLSKQPEWQVITVEEINKALCFNSDFTLQDMFTKSNMHKPLYSGLAARFFLEYKKNHIPNTDDIYGQAYFWFEYYHPECNGPLTEDDFVILVAGTPVDETLKVNASGVEVVEAVLTKIEISNVFDSDHRFMKRLAYVETQYGTEIHTFHYGGIWGVNYDILRHLRLALNGERESEMIQSKLINICTRIEEAFTIDNNIITMMFDKDKMNVPLYNGLAARFYLYYVSLVNASIPLAGNIRDQAGFWIRYYHSDSRNLTSQYFVDHASIAEDNEGIIIIVSMYIPTK